MWFRSLKLFSIYVGLNRMYRLTFIIHFSGYPSVVSPTYIHMSLWCHFKCVFFSVVKMLDSVTDQACIVGTRSNHNIDSNIYLLKLCLFFFFERFHSAVEFSQNTITYIFWYSTQFIQSWMHLCYDHGGFHP